MRRLFIFTLASVAFVTAVVAQTAVDVPRPEEKAKAERAVAKEQEKKAQHTNVIEFQGNRAFKDKELRSQLKEQIADMRQRRNDLNARSSILQAKQQIAQAKDVAATALGGIGGKNLSEDFQKLEDKVALSNARSDARLNSADVKSGKALDDKLADLHHGPSVDDRLEALKKQMNTPAQ